MKQWLAVAALYLLVALLRLWPAFVPGGTSIIGGAEEPDWTGTAWVFWWCAEALRTGQDLFYGAPHFQPTGQGPLSQFNVLDGIVATPLVWLFGARVAYNLFGLLALATSALGLHRLCRVAGADHLGASVAGVLLILSNYMGVELREGRLTQVLLLPWFLALAGLVLIARGGCDRRQVIATGCWAAASALVYWYNAVFLAVAALPLAVGLARTRRAWLQLGGAAALAALICLPPVVVLAQGYSDLPGVQRALEPWMNQLGPYTRDDFGLGMAIRRSQWLLWPVLSSSRDASNQTMAWSAVGLALLPLLWRPRGRLVWLGVALVGYLMVLGPYVRLAEPRPLPYSLPFLFLHDHLPFFDRFWWPDRFSIVATTGVAVLAALHAHRVAQRWWFAAPLLALLVGGEAWLRFGNMPIPANPTGVVDTALYSQLDGKLLTLPIMSESDTERFALWAQTEHHLPISTGLGAWLDGHRPAAWRAWVEGNSFTGALAALSRGDAQATRVEPAAIEALREAGFRWVVLDIGAFAYGVHEEWRDRHQKLVDSVLGPPDLKAARVMAWRLDPIDEVKEVPSIRAVGLRGGRAGAHKAGGRKGGGMRSDVPTSDGAPRPPPP